MIIAKQLSSVFNIWKNLFSLVKRYPSILVPFLTVAFLDSIILTIIFLAPRPPISIVLAPIIKAFWGEQFLHYPTNFMLLPKLFNYSRSVSGFIFGVFFTSIAIMFISQAVQNRKPKWWLSITKVLKKYMRLLIIWSITLAGLFVTMKILGYLYPIIASKKIIFSIEFLTSIFTQMFFVFAIPSVIIENRKVYGALVRSLTFCKNYPIEAFVFIAVPGLLFIPLTYLYIKLPYLMGKTFPEITLYVLAVRIILINVIDFFITSSVTLFLYEHRKIEVEHA